MDGRTGAERAFMKPKPAPHPFTLAFANILIGTAILSITLASVVLWSGFSGHDLSRNWDLEDPSGLVAFVIGGIMLALVSLPIVHLLVLLRGRPATTHGTRDMIVPVAILTVGAVFIVAFVGVLTAEESPSLHLKLLFPCLLLAFSVMIACGMNVFLAFSIPSNWISIIPLLVCYLGFYIFMILFVFDGPLLLGFMYWGGSNWGDVRPALLIGFVVLCFYIFLAGMIFPTHRRVARLWQPRPIPKIRSRTGGFTLIELLIVVAIVAILSVAFMTVVSRARAFTENMEVSRESLALIEDEMAVLRTQAAPLEPGLHPVDPKVAALHTRLAPLARVEISETSGPLVQARVTVGLKNRWAAEDLSLATLIAPRREVPR